jgi:hypothetical protein
VHEPEPEGRSSSAAQSTGGAGWVASSLDRLPRAAETEPGPAWYPLQHVFGLTGFGANAFVARAAGDTLIEKHDETKSGQEELYVVVGGRARFTLAGEDVDAPAVTVIAVRDPSTARQAVALEAGTKLFAFGAVPSPEFRSTWRPAHFQDVPRLL